MTEANLTINDAMAAEIRAQRGALSWTQKELAMRAGIKYDTMKNVLAGVHNINVTQIFALAKAFKMTPEELVQLAERRLDRMSEASGMLTDHLEDRESHALAAQGLDAETSSDESAAP